MEGSHGIVCAQQFLAEMAKCSYDGIGRRAVFKNLCRDTCRFESYCEYKRDIGVKVARKDLAFKEGFRLPHILRML